MDVVILDTVTTFVGVSQGDVLLVLADKTSTRVQAGFPLCDVLEVVHCLVVGLSPYFGCVVILLDTILGVGLCDQIDFLFHDCNG